ncbi:UPF0715 family protein [Sediminibacillus halophilus]|uniref:Uncharacterized protein family (UPF0715) n=1 Tax=Sediminibacillus halophilus TaxID=482461 RepID=A0A1G9SYH2_9BACI|nr:Uncharacterised protein family (UPF0715) [Sediminibacillus halophilus]
MDIFTTLYDSNFFIFLITALPLSLLLNKRKKKFSIIDLILYMAGALIVMQIIDDSLIFRMVEMTGEKLKKETGLYTSYGLLQAVVIGSGIPYII